jgi:hypothetical protein
MDSGNRSGVAVSGSRRQCAGFGAAGERWDSGEEKERLRGRRQGIKCKVVDCGLVSRFSRVFFLQKDHKTIFIVYIYIYMVHLY